MSYKTLEKRQDFDRMTNEEFVSHCLNFSDYGALCQSVVIQALAIGTKKMLEHKDESLKNYDEIMSMTVEERKEKKVGIPFVNYHAWYGALEELERRLNFKYGKKTEEN